MMNNAKHLFICLLGNLDFLKYSGFFVQFLKIDLFFSLWICNISLYVLEMSHWLEIYIQISFSIW